MANTLNLGNGNWATKEDSLLAYNSENGNFKPLPFDFTRASSATVVNKAGLIETVGSGEPRIDFSNDAKGALLLEPTRTNIIPRSEDIDTGWSKSNATVTNNQTISPNGTLNAGLVTATSTTGQHILYDTLIGSVTAGADYFISCFVKKSTTRYIRLQDGYSGAQIYIDLDTNSIISETGGASESIIENYGNGWFRVGLKFTANSSGNSQFALYVNDNSNNNSYTGSGEAVYVFGAQIEQGSYATSYIPNFGNSAGATRSADACNNGGLSSGLLSNKTSATFFMEFNYPLITITTDVVRIQSFGSLNGRAYLWANEISFAGDWAGASQQVSTTQTNKVIWRLNTLSNGDTFVGGVKGANHSGTAWANIDGINFLGYGVIDIKNFQVYDTALTDEECIKLTTI